MKTFILSVDGGGIRGIIPAMFLQKVQTILGKPLNQVFSMVSGTSTGALIAAAVAVGADMNEVVNIYLEDTKKIFSGFLPQEKRLIKGSMYSIESVHKVLVERLGQSAASLKLNELPIDILLTAKAKPSGKPLYYVKDNPYNAKLTGELNLFDCAVASAAAPTYFPAFNVPGSGLMVDGGVGVTGNPVYQTCVEAFIYNKYKPQETVVLSLGTGRCPISNPNNFLLNELNWVLSIVLDAPLEQQTEVLQRHYAPYMAGFYRYQIDLPMAVDMADAAAVPSLQPFAEKMISTADIPKIFS